MTDPIKNLVWQKHPRGSVTQWFGENPMLYARWGLRAHNGIDIVAPHGTPMYAVEDGLIVGVDNDPSGTGKALRIRSKVKDKDGYYRCWTYGHCSKIHVKDGDVVKEGDLVADMGNTGFVVSGATPYWKYNPYAGTHLHLALRSLKPGKNGWTYSGDTLKYNVVDYDNGYKGSIDPITYFEETNERPATRAQMLTLLSLANTLRDLLRLRQSRL